MGPIVREDNEPVFHHDWERRVFALMISTFAGGQYSVDEVRHAIERMDPAHYLASSSACESRPFSTSSVSIACSQCS